MSFAAIKGQDKAISFLKALLKNKRMSHAYIFCGPSGVGKKIAAISFAKAMNCLAAAPAGEGPQAAITEGCGICDSCRKIESLTHPDVFILKPEKEEKGIKIDDVRALIKDIYLKPFQARRKVYIIDQAEEMKHEAANALLKTLEEPPQDSTIILIANDIKSLFHTIVSRSQVVRFDALGSDQLEDILINEHSMEKSMAHVLSKLSSGSLGEAVRYSDGGLFEKRSYIIEAAMKNSMDEFFFDDLSKDKIKLCLDILLSWYRDILAAKAGANKKILVNIDKIDNIYSESKRLGFDHLEKVINSILSTLYYMGQNTNMKLAMGALVFKINDACPTPKAACKRP